MSKLISPTVEQDIKARGVAQVIVVLNQPAGASALDLRGVKSHFTTSERSLASAVREDLVLRSPVGAAVDIPAEQSAVMYPNLGVMLGTVDQAGLNALEGDTDVASITGTPQISLIRPERVAAAAATSGHTWGIDFLRVPMLWDQGLTGAGIRVAHLDTGVDGRHPALRKALGGFADFELTMGRRVTPTPAPYDSGDHGTHTAATIAGREVKGRRIGVAPGADLYSGLVIEGGNVVARVLGGLDWALEVKAQIVSLSLGFRGWWEDFIPIVEILRARGVLPVIAVGNEGPGTSRSPGNYPAALSVGAHDTSPNVAEFSSSQAFRRGQDPLVPDLVGPGVNVISAAPGNRYQSMSGTSMATPHIAGLAALLWEIDPSKTAAEIELAIFNSCRRKGSMTQKRANRGSPDAVLAYQELTQTTLRPRPKGKTVKHVPAPSQPKGRARKTAKKVAKKNESAKKTTARRSIARKARRRD